MTGRVSNLFNLVFALMIEKCIMFYKNAVYHCIFWVQTFRIWLCPVHYEHYSHTYQVSFLTSPRHSMPRRSIHDLGAHTEFLTHPLADLCKDLNLKDWNTGLDSSSLSNRSGFPKTCPEYTVYQIKTKLLASRQ